MTGVTVTSSMGRNVYFSGKELTDAADFRSYPAQLFFDTFVAAIDVIDAINDGLAIGNKSSEYQRSRGTQIAGEYGGSGKRGLAANNRAASFDLDVRSHAHEFLRMHEAILENVFGDDRGAFGLSSQRHVLRLHIGGEARIFFGRDIGGFKSTGSDHANGVVIANEFHSDFFQLVQQRGNVLGSHPVTFRSPPVIAPAMMNVPASMRSGMMRCFAPCSLFTPFTLMVEVPRLQSLRPS